jgi:hypothetical protein
LLDFESRVECSASAASSQTKNQTKLDRICKVSGDLRGEAGISGLAKPNCNFWRDRGENRFHWWRSDVRL